MTRFPLAATLAGVLVCVPVAAQESFTIDSNHTFPNYEILHNGISIQRGRFNKTTGKITIDAAAKTGTADINIDAASIDTGLEKLEARLRAEDFFDVAKYPSITFKSTGFPVEDDNVKTVPGNLTILGVTRPVTLSANQFKCTTHPMLKRKMCGGDFVATIRRTEFGMKYGISFAADEVTLRINVEAIKD
jgi:polyisoprenoid-binding protein YceI